MRDDTIRLDLPAAGTPTERPISIAIVAMGGQGGGVLSGWIVELAERQGWVAQSTSVPGVAQRTGATIYYVEMMPPLGGRKPILAQMPTPGDVDVVVASEYMEAGRSLLRGIVTPDRTTLIASDHRTFAISEKIAPGDGIADDTAVRDAIHAAAKRSIVFNMEALATKHGSVVSAAMFGALAGSGVLPFGTESYLAVMRAGGKSADASVATFEDAHRCATAVPNERPGSEVDARASTGISAKASDAQVENLIARARQELPSSSLEMVLLGLRKVIDYQDTKYGQEYLDIVARLHTLDHASGGGARRYLFTGMAAKYLANCMAYDDVIRVADLKTRASRRARVEAEVRLSKGQVLHTIEYMHPRVDEMLGMMPARIGAWLRGQDALVRWLDQRVNKGRRVRTYSLFWFLALYLLGALRRYRRSSLRHADELRHRDAWLERAASAMATNYQLGVEILQCQRLVKGYSDTHARGLSKFGRVMAAIQKIEGRDDAADWARRLREAAIKDAEGGLLDGTIQTIDSFC